MSTTLHLISSIHSRRSTPRSGLGLIGLCCMLGACGGSSPDDGRTDSPGDGGSTNAAEDGGSTNAAEDGGSTDATEDGGSTGSQGDGGASEPIVASWSVDVHDDIATVLVVSWTLVDEAEEGWLSYTFEDTEMQTPVRSWAVGAGQQPLFGIPQETDVTVTGTFVVDGVTQTVDLGTHQTGSLPDGLTMPTLVSWDPSTALDAPYVLASVDVGPNAFFGPCYTVIVDRQGRPVWYHQTSDNRLTLFPRVSRSGGHITIDASVYYQGRIGSITRVTLDLEQVEEAEITGFGLTYDELDDGSLVFDHAETGWDYHLERLYPDGERERIWSCYPWMSQYTDQFWGCAANTVVWNPERNTVLWGMFETSTFAEIDLDSGEKLWHAGQVADGYELLPESSMLWLQHYPNWTPDGTILTTTHVLGGGPTQAIREFELDEHSGVIEEVWTYIAEDGHYGNYGGDVTRLDNGNTLIGFGTGGVVQEVTPDGDVAWELDYENKLTGHMTPIHDLYDLNSGW